MTDIIVKDIKNGSEYYYGGSAEVSAEDVSYDNSSSGAVANNLQDAMDEVFQSVSNGKTLIAAAITDAWVQTAASDSFSTMAENIWIISNDIKTKNIFMPRSDLLIQANTSNIDEPASFVTQQEYLVTNNKYIIISASSDHFYSFVKVSWQNWLWSIGTAHFRGATSRIPIDVVSKNWSIKFIYRYSESQSSGNLNKIHLIEGDETLTFTTLEESWWMSYEEYTAAIPTYNNKIQQRIDVLEEDWWVELPQQTSHTISYNSGSGVPSWKAQLLINYV